MPVSRFYVPEVFNEQNILELKEKEAYHFTKVLRGQRDDEVELFNGNGSLAHCIVTDVSKNSVSVRIETVHKEPKKKCENVLIQALLRGSKLDLILEKGTELGIDAFHFFVADRSEKKELKPSQRERMEAIIVAASKQSGRLYLPTLHFHNKLSETPYTDAAYGSFEADATPLASHGFVNGPESGFSDKELELLCNCKKATLSTNILRTETAAIAAATVIGLLEIDR